MDTKKYTKNYFEVINERFSCRSFTAEKPSTEQIQIILESAQLAPTACNFQPQIIYVVENPVLLDPDCKARKCVIAKGIEHCGYCDRYPCDIFPAEPTQEEVVQKIEVEKQWTWEDEKLMEAYTCKKNMDEFRRNRIHKWSCLRI